MGAGWRPSAGWLALLLALACPRSNWKGRSGCCCLYQPCYRSPEGLVVAGLMGLALVLALGWWLAGGVMFSIPGLGNFG